MTGSKLYFRDNILAWQHLWFVFLKNYVILCTLVIFLPSFDTPYRNSSLCDQQENIIPCVEFNIV